MVTYKVLAISGSLRKKSLNTSLLHAAKKLAPDTLKITVQDISGIPLYNSDVEAHGFPTPVSDLKRSVKEADGILFATPEYNHAVSGVLKNTLDWVSRGENEWNDKPVAICGASDGIVGTARAQMNLRIIVNTINMHAMSKPLLQIPTADKKFNEAGNLTDEKTEQKLREFLIAFSSWIERLHFRT